MWEGKTCDTDHLQMQQVRLAVAGFRQAAEILPNCGDPFNYEDVVKE